MAGQITLYKDSALTQALTNGAWTTYVDLGTGNIPGSGSSAQTPVACYGKNTGTTTMRDIYITPITGGSPTGADLVADAEIAPDVTGAAGSFGSEGAQVQVFTGNLGIAIPVPGSNTSGNITNPTTAPTLSVGSGSSNLPAGTYTVAYSFTNSTGETLISNTATITITAGQTIQVASIALGTNATGVNYYMSFRAGNSTTFYSAKNGGGANITLTGAQGFFQFWIRTNLHSTDTPGLKQAQIQLDCTNIG